MKKFGLCLLALMLAAGSLFAEITWSGGGRLVFVPFGIRFANGDWESTNPGNDVATYFGAENPWSGDGPRLGLTVAGSRAEGNMGFKVSLNLEQFGKGNYNLIDDQAANLWLQPFGGVFETLRFTFGMYQVDNLRFKFAGAGSSFHNYIWYVRGDMTDEDATFRRFHSSGFGTHIGWEPIQNLWLGWGVGSVGDARSFANEFKPDGWLNAIIDSQFGIGYTIPDVGLVRAQFIGMITKEWKETKAASFEMYDNSGTPSVRATSADYGWANTIDKPLNGTGDAPKVQVAFNLTAVKGLNLDVGGSIPFAYERDYWNDAAKTTKTRTEKTQDEYVASLGFDLTMFSPFRLWGLTSVKLGGFKETTPAGGSATKVNKGTDFAIHLTPMYTITQNNIVGADLFFDIRAGSDETPSRSDSDPTPKWDANAKNNYTDLGFGVFYRRNIPGGDIRVAVTTKLPGGEAHKGASPQIFIPIMFNYGF